MVDSPSLSRFPVPSGFSYIQADPLQRSLCLLSSHFTDYVPGGPAIAHWAKSTGNETLHSQASPAETNTLLSRITTVTWFMRKQTKWSGSFLSNLRTGVADHCGTSPMEAIQKGLPQTSMVYSASPEPAFPLWPQLRELLGWQSRGGLGGMPNKVPKSFFDCLAAA